MKNLLTFVISLSSICVSYAQTECDDALALSICENIVFDSCFVEKLNDPCSMPVQMWSLVPIQFHANNPLFDDADYDEFFFTVNSVGSGYTMPGDFVIETVTAYSDIGIPVLQVNKSGVPTGPTFTASSAGTINPMAVSGVAGDELNVYIVTGNSAYDVKVIFWVRVKPYCP